MGVVAKSPAVISFGHGHVEFCSFATSCLRISGPFPPHFGWKQESVGTGHVVPTTPLA